MSINSITFSIQMAYGNLRRRSFFSTSIIVSLLLGLLFPVLVITFGYSGINHFNSSGINDFNKVVLLNIENGTLAKADMEKTITANSNIDTVSRFYSFQATVISKGNYSRSNINAIDSNYRSFLPIDLSKGKWFESGDFNKGFECIVGKNISKGYIGSKILGEKISILGNSFKIIGVTDNANFSESIIIPVNCLDVLRLNSQNLTYYIKFKDGNQLEKQADSFQDYILDNFKLVSKIKLYKDTHKDAISKAFTYTIALFLITGVVLLYSLINIMNIILNKIDEDRKAYGIKLALGASKVDIYIQNFFELIILSLCASILVILVLPIITYIINNYIFGYFPISINLYVVFAVVFICIIISFTMSLLTLKKITRFNITEILR